MAWKFVIFKNDLVESSVYYPIIFPDPIVHRDIFAHVRPLMPGWHGKGVTAHSAGKIERVSVAGLGGDSETLAIAAKRGDDRLIEQFHIIGGIYPK